MRIDSLNRKSTKKINIRHGKLGSTNMKKQSKSEYLIPNKSHAKPLIVFLVVSMSILTSPSLYPVSAQEQGEEPLAFISEIRNLLNQTLDAYENQNYDEADTLATEAYLDNYEFIEEPLGEQNETLMETTEVMLREELRQLIQNNASLQEIQDNIDNINSNLDQAETLLDGPSQP